jgi:hemolysin activation/secretion protein
LVDIALNSPAGKGEQYTLGLMDSTGTQYGRAGVSFPVGLNGARLGMNASFMAYTVIAGGGVISNIHGTSNTAGIDLSYPLVRSQQANLFLSGGISNKRFDNYSGDNVTRRLESNSLTVSGSGNWIDGYLGGGSNQGSLSVTAGAIRLKDSLTILTDQSASGPKVDNGFNKVNGSFSRTQAVRDWLSLLLSVSGQYAWKNLDSSEKFYLGGPTGVRAYPVSEGGGTNGLLDTVELRMKLPRGWELRLFHDHGRVKQFVDWHTAMGTMPNILSYRGYGASLVWQGPGNLTVTAKHGRDARCVGQCGTVVVCIRRTRPDGAAGDGPERVRRRWWQHNDQGQPSATVPIGTQRDPGRQGDCA